MMSLISTASSLNPASSSLGRRPFQSPVRQHRVQTSEGRALRWSAVSVLPVAARSSCCCAIAGAKGWICSARRSRSARWRISPVTPSLISAVTDPSVCRRRVEVRHQPFGPDEQNLQSRGASDGRGKYCEKDHDRKDCTFGGCKDCTLGGACGAAPFLICDALPPIFPLVHMQNNESDGSID